MDWQKDDIIMPLFGWMNKDGFRRFRRAYIEIPKKNGKSTLCAAIANYFLLADGEPGAEVYCAGTDRQQANIVFKEASSMIRKSGLIGMVNIIDSTKTMNYNDNSYHALAADADSSEGKNIHALIFDELHAQKNRKFWDALYYGGEARKQPMSIAITTAGYDRESICWEEREIARQVLEGIGDIAQPTIFGYIAGADLEDDWTDIATWKKANPSFGIIIKKENIEEAIATAKMSPAKINQLKRYRLNIWTHGENRAVEPEDWAACKEDFSESDLIGRECYGGLDLAAKCDLAAFVLSFTPIKKDEPVKQLAFSWCPREGIIDRTYKDGVNYELWTEQGHIEATPGKTIDFDYIERAIGAIYQKFDLRLVGYDRWGSWEVVPRLEKNYGIKFLPFGQGFGSMAGPTSDWLRFIQQKKIAHNGNPVFAWNVDNLVLNENPGGDLKPDKEASKEKIDIAVASIMSLGICLKECDLDNENATKMILAGV